MSTSLLTRAGKHHIAEPNHHSPRIKTWKRQKPSTESHKYERNPCIASHHNNRNEKKKRGKTHKTPCSPRLQISLRALAAETAGQLDILGLDGNSLGMNGTQVGIFEKGNKVSLDRLLESTDSGRLEAEVRLEVLCNFTDQTLEGQLPNQQLGGLLVPTDLTEGDGSYGTLVIIIDA